MYMQSISQGIVDERLQRCCRAPPSANEIEKCAICEGLFDAYQTHASKVEANYMSTSRTSSLRTNMSKSPYRRRYSEVCRLYIYNNVRRHRTPSWLHPQVDRHSVS